MTRNEFWEEYSKLFRYFKDKDPDEDRATEYHELLKFMPFERFRQICRTIKENEDKLPFNVVAYCNNLRRESGEREVGGSKPPDSQEKIECVACQDTGFIGITVCVDSDTGKKARKAREIGDRGIEFACRCLCSKGQKLASCIPFASEQEVVVSAKINGLNKSFQLNQKQRQLDYEEIPCAVA